MLITESVEPAVPLPTVIAAADRLADPLRRAVTIAVADAVAKLHAGGLFPGDLHPGNLFLRGLQPLADGGFGLEEDALEPVLIDLAPLYVRRGWPRERRRIARSLGMLAHGVSDVSTAADRLRFLAAHYTALFETNGTAADMLGEWRDWVALMEAIRQTESNQRHARRDRHWRRGCRGMRIIDRETRCVAGIADEEAGRMLAATGDGPAAIGGRAVRVLRVSPSAARSGWEIGHALRRRGLPVAEPLVCRQGRFDGTLVLAAGPPVQGTCDDRRAARRICAALRACGYTLDGPHPEDFQRAADGAVQLANPAAVRRAGRDEVAPTPDFGPACRPIPPLRRAA
ncbi:hypothetical protein LzC2_40080 [Planctomycetes bacterium LzC2]|uniref:Uncharacterized protein n=1 Tax=Alienimonas chondri TaxID=2681879 RepID=A0ABX1VIF5_9PLAN|nr:hypothetical protein [Alienimonas chondri]